MEKTYFGPDKPDAIVYIPRHNSMYADVYLRKNIEEIEVEDESTDEEGKPIIVKSKMWQADEVYNITDASEAEIIADFDNFFYKFGPQPTIEERLDVVEGVIGEIMEG